MNRQMKDEELRIELGQHFMAGFQGTELTEELRQFFREYKVGNVILFRHNVENQEQLKRLCGDLQACIRESTGYDALIGIDQEGGIVTRLTNDMINIPGAMAIAAAGGPEEAYTAGRMTGRQLRAVGVNFDFAPVMDINCNQDNPVIGVRSYGDTPEQVTAYGTAMLRGLQEEGVLACAKHFPGHGDTNLDSHRSLPCVDKPAEALRQMEFVPFQKAVEAGVAGVMTAHILFPQLEPEQVPATMSRRILTGILREEMGFEGLIVSDSVEMAAIDTYYGIERGAAAALQAGVDIVMPCHDPANSVRAINYIEEKIREGDFPLEELKKGTQRILRMKQAYRVGDEVWNCGGDGNEAYGDGARRWIREIVCRSVTAYPLPAQQQPELGANPLFIGSEAYRATLASNDLKERMTFADWMAQQYGGESLLYSRDPDDEEIRRVLAAAAGHSALVAGSYNGHLYPGQRQLLARLTEAGVPVLLITLGMPYDICDVPEEVFCLSAWEYSERSFEALLPVLRKQAVPQGRMPVRIVRKNL